MVGKDIAITSGKAKQKSLTSSVKSSSLIIQIANQTFFEANHWLIHKRLKEVNLESDQDLRIVKNHGDVRPLLPFRKSNQDFKDSRRIVTHMTSNRNKKGYAQTLPFGIN